VLTEYGYTNPLAKVNTCSTESKKILYAAASSEKTTENMKGRNSLLSNNRLKWAFLFYLLLSNLTQTFPKSSSSYASFQLSVIH